MSAEANPNPVSEVRLGLLGNSTVSEDLVSMRAYLEDQLVQKSALLDSVALKISQLQNKVLRSTHSQWSYGHHLPILSYLLLGNASNLIDGHWVP